MENKRNDAETMIQDRPIFLVGHPRAGTTFLGSIILSHPDVGPKPTIEGQKMHPPEYLSRLTNQDIHYDVALAMEQKDVWFDYFPGREAFTTMGRDCISEDLDHLTADQIDELISRLTVEFTEQRFFSKAPTNSFRLKAIRRLFPSAKIVILTRRPVEVIGSYLTWSVRPMYRELGYLSAIKMLNQRWKETFTYLFKTAQAKDLVITYDDLIDDFDQTIAALFEFLELSIPSRVSEVKPVDSREKWKVELPLFARLLLIILTLNTETMYRKRMRNRSVSQL